MDETQRNGTDPASGLEPIGDPDGDGQEDFAGEHEDTTLSREQPGGPESVEEDAAPEGLAGQD